MITVYGIKNCDSVKKARRWLDEHGVEHRFHDFRGDGLDHAMVAHWCRRLGWETLLNTRSRTWKELPAAARTDLDAAAAVDLMVAHPTLVKRPVLVSGDMIHVGFKEDLYAGLFGH